MKRTAVVAAALLATALAAAPCASGQTHFRPDLQHRPRLAFDGRDADHIRRVGDRVRSGEQPWAGAYATLRDRAETGQVVDHRTSGWAAKPDPYVVLYGQEATNGRVAAAKAAVAWLYTQGLDPAWRPLPHRPGEATPEGWARDQAAAAARAIARMYGAWPCQKGFQVINRGIVAADALAANCEAFDLLAALPAALRPSLAEAEERIADLAADLDFWFFTVDAQNTNHGIRVASGLGIAAIAINRHDRYRWWKPATAWLRPGKWIAKAERELHPTDRGSDLAFQLSTGGYAEGTSYLTYAADLYMPFFFGYNRFLSGGGVPFLRSDAATGAARWMVDLRLPDGRRPAIDNSRPHHDMIPGFFLSRVAGGARSEADQAVFLWDWKAAGFPGSRGARAISLLAAYDPPPAVEAAAAAMTDPFGGQPTRFMERQGQAVLRSGAGAGDAYALVLAERGDARTRGAGHEAADNGAYTFWAHGDWVTIDPGYPGWSEVTKVNSALNRSMVLVDGKGPRPAHQPWGVLPWVSGGTDARLVSGPRTAAGAAVQSAEVETAYEGASIRRTVALVEGRYLLVEDRCSSRRPKAFTTQVQTNAGIAKGRPIQGAGNTARWETYRARAKACAGAAASAALGVAVSSEYDAFDGPEGHEAVKWSASGRDVTFLSAVAADAPGAAWPSVEAIAGAQGGAVALRIEAGGAVDIAISNPARARASVPEVAGARAISTDAELAVVSFAPSGQARVLRQVGGTFVTVAQPVTRTATRAVTR